MLLPLMIMADVIAKWQMEWPQNVTKQKERYLSTYVGYCSNHQKNTIEG